MDAETLKELSNEYWRLRSPNSIEAQTFYLCQAKFNEWLDKSLLAYEMEFAQNREGANLPPKPEADVTLVILVGESFEPLLQSIWHYQPKKIVPIVNNYYGNKYRNKNSRKDGHIIGEVHWGGDDEEIIGLYAWIKMLYEQEHWTLPEMPNTTSIQPISKDTPTAVFKHLRQELKDDLDNANSRLIIDITGAKKTIMAGAFLFAAYTDAEISYIEVDEYADDGQGHPYGFMCRFVNPVQNPIKDLYLENWTRAYRHFNRYDFSGALAALPEPKEFLDKELTKLRDFLWACAYWADGVFYQAGTMPLSQSLWEQLPQPIHQLSVHWPEPGDKKLKESLFQKHERILWYAYDEINRINQLCNLEALRAAFNRAYALHETLLKAQTVALCINNQLQLSHKGYIETYANNRHLKESFLMWIIHKTNPINIRELLKNGKISDWTFRYSHKQAESYIDFDVSTTTPLLAQAYFPSNDLSKRRNLMTHTYFPVLDEDINEAIEVAKRNLQHYEDYWKSFTEEPTDYAAIAAYKYEPNFDKWKQILALCDLEEFATQP